MGSSVTVRDIAEAANVSHGTVSRVLNDHPSVSDDNRRRVLQAATELGYFSSQKRPTRGKARQENRLPAELGFLLAPGIDAGEQNFWIRILHGVETEATRQGIRVMYRAIGDLADSPDRLRMALHEMGLRCVLLVGDADPVVVAVLQELTVPFVLVGSRMPGAPHNAVVTDDFEGTYHGIRHLIELGHRRIAFIGNTVRTSRNIPIYALQRRAFGYAQAMREADIYDDALLVTGEGRLYVHDGYDACRHLIDHRIPFTALFCASDLMALGAVRALSEAGLEVPGDVSVIGEESPMTSQVMPNLTTIRTYPELMGSVAVNRIRSMLATPESSPLVTMVPMDLVLRESVAPAAGSI